VRAIRFQGTRVLDRLALTLSASGDSSHAAPIQAFLGDAPVAVHDRHGVLGLLESRAIRLTNPLWDVQELAAILLPSAIGYALGSLLGRLGGDAEADDVADAIRQVFLALTQRAARMGPAVLSRLAGITAGGLEGLAELFAGLAETAQATQPSPSAFDHSHLNTRLERPRPLGKPRSSAPLDSGEIDRLLGADGPFSRRFPHFQPRPEQVAMAQAVAEALSQADAETPHRLLVEGGTGTGKSVAYLLPAVLFSLRNNARVVISTHTINLQEQLVQKDIPALLKALADVPGLDLSRFRYTQLKGKANYLCVRRWDRLAAAGPASGEEARLLAKTLVWMEETESGDRAEVQLRGREISLWDRLSAAAFSTCPGMREGGCFYRHARERAAASQLVVVNHALLLSDALVGGSLLPEYDHLIIDEAHNLEDEATRQFGFHVSQFTVDEIADRLLGIVQGLGAALRVAKLEEERGAALHRSIDEAQMALQRVRGYWTEVAGGLGAFSESFRSSPADDEGSLRITSGSRSQPAWSDLELLWDNYDRALAETGHRANALLRSVEQLPEGALPGAEEVVLDLGDWLGREEEVREHIAGFVAHPDQSMVYWIDRSGGPASMNGAPLEVGGRLQDLLFTNRSGVVLTSATLTVRDQFTHLRRRLGFEEADELRLGSPFDYERAALLCLPIGMPEPNEPGYQEALSIAVRDLALGAGGYTMALFTSHAAVRATAQAIRGSMKGIEVLAQGIDGPPQQLLRRFQADPRAVLLGTASFWEGVDVGNSALKVLIVARLPFNVPTDPVFAARSEQYEQPFIQYAVPQAVLRFRQGFGRLIRGKDDRGAVVVLDSRLTGKSYGGWFLASLPSPTRFQSPMDQVASEVRRWLEAVP